MREERKKERRSGAEASEERVRRGTFREAVRLARACEALDEEGRCRRLGRVRDETVKETP